MLIAARYLVDRMRHVPSRAEELLALRRRLAAQPGPAEVDPQEVAAATELEALRREISQAIGAIGPVRSCGGCAQGHPEPNGHWPGGHCCGARTADLFNDDEVAALSLAGTTPGRLRAPVGDHAGCSFRGAAGCSLSASDRPNLCVRYLCPDLVRELHQRGDLPHIEALCASLEQTYLRFIELRAERLSQQELALG